jgi:hypothetical protein
MDGAVGAGRPSSELGGSLGRNLTARAHRSQIEQRPSSSRDARLGSVGRTRVPGGRECHTLELWCCKLVTATRTEAVMSRDNAEPLVTSKLASMVTSLV